jgi:hypothetical protein
VEENMSNINTLAVMALLAAVTPLAAEPCPLPAPALVINEVMYKGQGDQAEYVELKGPAGTSLACFQLVGLNGGTAGDQCAEYNTIDLGAEGKSLDAAGYFVVAADASVPGADLVSTKADYQNGPDALMLAYGSGAAMTLVDLVTYGKDLPACAAANRVEGGAVPDSDYNQSLSRCPDGADTGDNQQDFAITAILTPGAANQCPPPKPECDEPADVRINEILYSTNVSGDGGAFIELKGPAGADLGCFTLVAMNGNGCVPYAEIALSGVVSADGYFVVAKDDSVAGAEAVNTKADLQNGPDGLRLVYHHASQGDLVADAVFYGSQPEGCLVAEGEPAKTVAKGSSLARVPDGADSGDNAADFVECANPTPGAPNSCSTVQPGCDLTAETLPAGLVINELYYTTGESGDPGAFIELKGPAGLDLKCFALKAINGAGCEQYALIALTGSIKAGGYYVVAADQAVAGADLVAAAADLQNGPDAVELVYRASSGTDLHVDGVGYGEGAATCPGGEGVPAVDVESGYSLARLPDGADTQDNSADLHACDTPTPGALNACSPPPCTGEPVKIVINEVLTSVTTGSKYSAFVELKGPAGTDLSCYRLLGVNGADCRAYNLIDLEGAIPEDGYFVVADGATIADAEMSTSKADFQEGPDGLALVYLHGVKGELMVDSLAYGAVPATCAVGEGATAPLPGKDTSLTRLPDGTDTDVNQDDFKTCSSPTPGKANACKDIGGPGTPTQGGGGGAACAVQPGHPTATAPLLLPLGLLLVGLGRGLRATRRG